MEVNVNHRGVNCFFDIVNYVRKEEENSPGFNTFKKISAYIATTVINLTPIGMVTSTMFVQEYMHQVEIVKWMNGVGEEKTAWVTARKVGLFFLAFLQIFTVFGVVTFGVFLYEWYLQSKGDMSVLPKPKQTFINDEQLSHQPISTETITIGGQATNPITKKSFKERISDANQARALYEEALNLEKNSNYDQEDIAKLFEQSAELGNTDACYEIGSLYIKGMGVKQDITKAIYFFEKICSRAQVTGQHNNDAKWQLFLLYYEVGGNENLQKAFKLLERMLIPDQLPLTKWAYYWLGRFYEEGLVDNPNIERAEHYYWACSSRSACPSDAFYRLGKLYQQSGNREEQAIKMIGIAASKGHQEALKELTEGTTVSKMALDDNYFPKSEQEYLDNIKTSFINVVELPDNLLKNISFLTEALKIINPQFSCRLLELADPLIMDDKEFVLEAIKINPFAYQYASTRLSHRKEIIIATIESVKNYIKNKNKNDSDVIYCDVLELIAKSLKYQSGDFSERWVSDDKEIILNLAFEGYKIYICPSLALQKDTAFMKQLIEKYVGILIYADECVLDNKELIEFAIKIDPDSINLASEQLKDDIKLQELAEAIRKNKKS